MSVDFSLRKAFELFSNVIPVFLLGLLAGGVSCAAVQGGLLAGLVARQRGPASAQVTAKDDLSPVGGFLAGKLLSHAVLGLLLGALGSAVELSLQLRTLAQLLAGVLIILMGLAQLGVKSLRGLVFEPPASWTRLVRGQARSKSALAPALLGLASVLIPCGVTLSVMALAVTSGNPLAGMLTMVAFVIGTAPLFTAVGYLAARARRAAGPWQKRITVATGVVVLALGLYTLNGGLELSGSPISASQLTAAFADGPAPVITDATPGVVGGRQTVIIKAVEGGYLPGNMEIKAGIPTTLVVRSEKARGCVRAFVIPSLRVEKTLPVNGDTAIELGTLKPGVLRYSCGMGMYTGRLTIVEPK